MKRKNGKNKVCDVIDYTSAVMVKSILLSSILLICVSCSPSLNEIWINENGSGQFETTFDMGETIGMMDGMFELKETQDSSVHIKENPEVIDSIFTAFNTVPDSIKVQLDNPELLKNIEIHIHMDKTKEEMLIKMSFKYDSADHYEAIMEEMIKADKAGNQDNSMMAMASQEEISSMFMEWETDQKNGVIRISRIDILSELEKNEDFQSKELFNTLDSLDQPGISVDAEILSMVEMIIGRGSKTIVHAPRDILFTNDLGATIEGKKVTFLSDPVKYLKQGVKPPSDDIIIKLKD